MASRVVLCADTASMRYPETIGLEGEDLLAQPWLRVFSQAQEARAYIRGNAVEQVWVVSCDDVDPINSAAAFKDDAPSQQVFLVAFDKSGSLQSRAHQAGIDAVFDRREFLGRYGEEKRRFHIEGGLRNPAAGRCAAMVSPARMPVLHACDVPEISLPLEDDPFAAAPTDGAALGGMDAAGSSVFAAPVGHSAGERSVVGNARIIPARSVESPVPARGAESPLPAEGARAALAITPKPVRGRSAFIMPIVSGSGGAGKSTISVLCAVIARNRGYETLLLDLDLQFGDLQSLLGMKDPLHLDDLIDSPAKISSVQAQGNLPAFIAAPRRFERAEEVAEKLPELLDDLQSRFDVIVANTGGFWAEQHAVMLERSSKTLFLIDQRPSSLGACRRAIELCTRCGIATSPLLFAVNRCSKNALYSSIDVSCTLRGAPAVELRDGGSEVEELVSAGHPFELLSNPNDLGESLIRLMDEVLPKRAGGEQAEVRPVPSRKRPRGLFRSSRRRDAACLG